MKMNNECLYCKNYESCEVIKQLTKWREERNLVVEGVKATWVIDSMTCDLHEQDVSLPEYLMRQENGKRFKV